jgi:hypothetical protein
MLPLIVLYTIASLAHFVHNAEFIAFYPGMPEWLNRETVYLAWLGVAAAGVGALIARSGGFPRVAAGLLAVYGALGLDGLLHYTLGLCSEHTLVTNVTIWSESVLGLAVACASAVWFSRITRARRHPASP